MKEQEPRNIGTLVVEGKCGPENTTKIRVPEAGMEVEMLAGHARALKQEEVL